jgi:hypothetical protein
MTTEREAMTESIRTLDGAVERLLAIMDVGLSTRPTRIESLQELFQREGYCVIRGVVGSVLLTTLSRYALARYKNRMLANDVKVPGIPSAYADPLMEELLWRLIPLVESITGRKVFPTYSFFRIYRSADSLFRHKDRNACELSMSVNLKTKANLAWPLWIETGDSHEVPITLEAGDVIIYKGIELTHWREPFAGLYNIQTFLHYVSQDGPYADQRYDGREKLSRIGNTATAKTD